VLITVVLRIDCEVVRQKKNEVRDAEGAALSRILERSNTHRNDKKGVPHPHPGFRPNRADPKEAKKITLPMLNTKSRRREEGLKNSEGALLERNLERKKNRLVSGSKRINRGGNLLQLQVGQENKEGYRGHHDRGKVPLTMGTGYVKGE